MSATPMPEFFWVIKDGKADPAKLLWHDGLGMPLYSKWLERGRAWSMVG